MRFGFAGLDQCDTQPLQQLGRRGADMLAPATDTFIRRHGRNGRFGDGVVGEEVAGFLGGGEVEEAGVEPGFGVVQRISAVAHGAGDLAGILEPPVVETPQMVHPGLGLIIEMAVDDP